MTAGLIAGRGSHIINFEVNALYGQNVNVLNINRYRKTVGTTQRTGRGVADFYLQSFGGCWGHIPE